MPYLLLHAIQQVAQTRALTLRGRPGIAGRGAGRVAGRLTRRAAGRAALHVPRDIGERPA